MTDRYPQIRDVLVYDSQEYVIRVIAPLKDWIVLTQLGVPDSSTFVLKGAQLRWQDSLQAWMPVNSPNLFETDEPTSA